MFALKCFNVFKDVCKKKQYLEEILDEDNEPLCVKADRSSSQTVFIYPDF